MPIAASTVVNASPADLWTTISAPGYLEQCHPFCESNPTQRWPGAGSRDTIHYYSGRTVHRHFTAWEEGRGYDLVVTDTTGTSQARVRWRIGGDGSQLTIELDPHYSDHLSPPLRKLAYLLTRRQMTRYLQSVVAGVKHYAETGVPVVRNQFGPHRWFSPKR